jgi:hypothetical protein
MTIRNKTIHFVRENGNPLDQLRLRRALNTSYTRAEAEEILAAYQFSDGSWDYFSPQEKPDHIGSLGGTIHCLRWLREFDLGSSHLMARTLEFLISIQDSDGSFYETEAKLAHSPQEWLQEETIIDRFYFSAGVCMRLSSLGYKNSIIESALQWLEPYYENWGIVTGTWYNVWALLCSPAALRLGPLYQRCHTKAREWIPHLDPAPLTWFLDACQGAHFPKNESLVTEGLHHLLLLQNEEGFWPDPHAPVEVTITAVRLFNDYKVGNGEI